MRRRSRPQERLDQLALFREEMVGGNLSGLGFRVGRMAVRVQDRRVASHEHLRSRGDRGQLFFCSCRHVIFRSSRSCGGVHRKFYWGRSSLAKCQVMGVGFFVRNLRLGQPHQFSSQIPQAICLSAFATKTDARPVAIVELLTKARNDAHHLTLGPLGLTPSGLSQLKASK